MGGSPVVAGWHGVGTLAGLPHEDILRIGTSAIVLLPLALHTGAPVCFVYPSSTFRRPSDSMAVGLSVAGSRIGITRGSRIRPRVSRRLSANIAALTDVPCELLCREIGR